jgi:hypothetical protein
MSTIKIHRPKEYINSLRAYEIFVDGSKAGEIKNGAVTDLQVPPGKHSVSLKIDWAKSKQLEMQIQEGEIIELQAQSFPHAKWMMPTAFILIVAHILLKFTLGIQWVFYGVIPFFFILIYYITVGRSRYLVLKFLTGSKNSIS